ncbi:MAG: gliding motility protein GldC [Crocinitomicaceae bacterium]|jgi:gliding motility-associated protein GldC|nr:gliding motility protein GldC [Crocinitomicaceae bacterium]
MKKSNINIDVSLDENNLPVDMHWSAEGADTKQAKAMFLALWDGEEKNTMKLDLWVKEMSIEEMKQFFHQTMLTMADTFEKATGETNISEDLRDYCYHFADKMKIMPE